MKQINLFFIIVIISIVHMTSCTTLDSQTPTFQMPSTEQFNEYWYGGNAELSRYELDQARYGEIHQGEAVLIFVTEDFRTDQQVKYEGGSRENVTSILKLNLSRKFFTGLYPYSMMTSVFTPRDDRQKTLKVTTTSQEWCGHSFSQYNLKDDQYKGKLFSYFQNEGDNQFNLKAALLEDEIWAKIRLNPNNLPLGNIEIIPGTQYLRLSHKDQAVENAMATLTKSDEKSGNERSLANYQIDYKDLDRSLKITFESEFPFNIIKWEEQVNSGYGANRKSLVTKATLTKSIKSPYWNKNSVSDGSLKKELGLEAGNY